MKTREINIKRYQVTIDGFAMTLDELIRKLEQVKRQAKDAKSESDPLVGFPRGISSILNDALIVQWDQVIPDAEPEPEDATDPKEQT